MSELKEKLICDFCASKEDVINYHQNTLYTDKERNYVNLCPKCKIGNDEYWEDMWTEFYGGVL